MILKQIIDEDFVNYREPSMYLIFPHCSFKCDKENGTQYCQNRGLALEPDIEISKEAKNTSSSLIENVNSTLLFFFFFFFYDILKNFYIISFIIFFF